MWLTRARPRAHAGASVGAGAGARFGGMTFVSKEVHGEEVWRLSGGGLADWLTGWLAGLLVSSCPWLSGREASRRSTRPGRAWERGGVGVCICSCPHACGRDGRDKTQIWPDPRSDGHAMALACHATMPGPDQKGEAKHGRMFRSRILRRDQRRVCQEPGADDRGYAGPCRCAVLQSYMERHTTTTTVGTCAVAATTYLVVVSQVGQDTATFNLVMFHVLVYRAAGPVDVKLSRGPWPWGFRFPIRSCALHDAQFAGPCS